jgi:hypothetical protein
MEMPEGWFPDSPDATLVYGRERAPAPYAVRGSMLTLTGGAWPRDVLLSRAKDGESTTWRVAWISGSLVGYVSLTGADSDWSADSDYYADANDVEHVEPVAESAWTRPVASISAVSLAKVDARIETDRFNRERRKLWRASTVFAFLDGEHFTVPLFPERPARPGETETDFAFAQALIDAWRT